MLHSHSDARGGWSAETSGISADPEPCVRSLVSNLRSQVEAASEQELGRVAPLLADLTDGERAVVQSLARGLIDEVFEHLGMRVRVAVQTDPALLSAAEFFFLHSAAMSLDRAGDRTQWTSAVEHLHEKVDRENWILGEEAQRV